jgi:hypothetical protein
MHYIQFGLLMANKETVKTIPLGTPRYINHLKPKFNLTNT